MTKAHLFELIKEAGMHAVPLQADEKSPNTNQFDGTLDEFLQTAKSIGATAIFVETNFFDQCFFIHQIESHDELETEEEIESEEEREIDLTTISPTLDEFKTFVGKEYNFSMSAKGGADELNLEWFPPWYCEFEEEFEKAKTKIDEDSDARTEAQEQLDEDERIENSTKIRELVGRFVDDPKFAKIKTLREMKLYAFNKFPELEKLEQEADTTVQDAVRDVRDQINIKGFRN